MKKAFRRLDPTGTGTVLLDEVLLTLSAAPSLTPAAHHEMREAFANMATLGGAGRPVVSYPAFSSYYHELSGGIRSDSDFEQLLQAHWGYLEVHDILASMQKQFCLFGLVSAFQEPAQHGLVGEITLQELEACLKRIGLQPRPDDTQRVYNAFAGPGVGLRLEDLKEQLLAPRPETPSPMVSRELATPQLTSTSQPAAAISSVPLRLTARQQQEQQEHQQHHHPVAATLADVSVAAATVVPGVGLPNVAVNPAPAPPAHLAAAAATAAAGVTQSHPAHSPAQAPSAATAGGATVSPPVADALAGNALAEAQRPPPGEADLDAALQRMEADLHHLRRHHKAAADVPGKPGVATGAAPASGPTVHSHHSQHDQVPDGPISDADMDAALSNLEARLHHIKSHKAPATKPPVEMPPIEMPHWEHHKYGHRQQTEPAWKAPEKVTDIYGHQHGSSEYGFSNFGAGPHGHHLSHYHLNDYHGLAHHSFKPEDYQRSQFGAAGHHGHWVPHLHGIGLQDHQHRHHYKPDELRHEMHGTAGHHSHWVPHLHNMGHLGEQSGS